MAGTLAPPGAGTLFDYIGQAYPAWSANGEAGLAALAADAAKHDFNRSDMTSEAARLEQLGGRCIVSTVKARFLRALLAA